MTGEADREREKRKKKNRRPGKCQTRPVQSIREIGETNCQLHNLKAETPEWSAGHYHTPDSRLCSALRLCVCSDIKDATFSEKSPSTHSFLLLFLFLAAGLNSSDHVLGNYRLSLKERACLHLPGVPQTLCLLKYKVACPHSQL